MTTRRLFLGFIPSIFFLFSAHAISAACQQISGTAGELTSQGLAERPLNYYRTTGDNTFLTFFEGTQVNIYAGGDGKGYSFDPDNCDTVSSGWSTETIADMNVHVFVPSEQPSVAPLTPGKRPLMINLHGCMQTNTLLRDKGNWETTANEHGMIVALPDAPSAEPSNCWDAAGSDHSATTKDSDNVIALTKTLINRTELNIDSKQVYITGFSSGGMQAVLLGCLRPDLYAGVGPAGNPVIGTDIGNFQAETQNYQTTVDLCQSLAKSTGYSMAIDYQIASPTNGGEGDINSLNPFSGINTLHDNANATMYRFLYGAEPSDYIMSIPGYRDDGFEFSYFASGSKRIAQLSMYDLQYGWSTGDGQMAEGIDGQHVNYPKFVTEYFYEQNMRIHSGEENARPDIGLLGGYNITLESLQDWSDPGYVAWDCEDGDLTHVVEVQGPHNTTCEGGQPCQDKFFVQYSVTDSDGGHWALFRNITIEPPENFPPEITLLGENPVILQDILEWESKDPGVIARDEEDGDLTDKIESIGPFPSTGLDGQPSKEWYQVQYCVYDSEGARTCLFRSIQVVDHVCTEYTNNNPAHVSAGRAYTCGVFNWYACAVGSDDSLGANNVFTTTTVHEPESEIFAAGSCP